MLMTTFLWTPLPVFMLTVASSPAARRCGSLAVIALHPGAFSAAIYRRSIRASTMPDYFYRRSRSFGSLFVATLLPITVLILATGALGNEIEDQTLPYLR